MTDKYAVIGNPIAHSKSPLIHTEFAKQTHQDISYEAVLAPLDGFELKIQELIKAGYKGVNVTVPFKFEALDFCVRNGVVSPFAKTAGAVNTIKFDANGGIEGANTDGIGLINDITRNINFNITDKKVLLLGAGGAAFGVLQPLINAHPSHIVITNRTLSKAIQATKTFGFGASHASFGRGSFYVPPKIETKLFEDLADMTFDLIVNATSTGLNDIALPIPDAVFAQDCLAYDMMYGRETPFMAQARANGACVVDGLGMLVEQAAEAFYLWRGVRPETQPVIEMMRAL
jgi:shikimate dehydrogenase